MSIYTKKQQVVKPHSLDSEPPVGSCYIVEGRRVLLDCLGSGSPTVVFIPAAGMIGLDYLNIHQKLVGVRRQ